MKALLRNKKRLELLAIPEVNDRSNFIKKVFNMDKFDRVGNFPANSKLAIEGGIMAYLLHCEARIASYLGYGFYTIGPCGEELFGAISLNLSADDLSAFHYRHVSNSIVLQLKSGRTLEDIALDRARAYVCSIKDPVTGGKHCSIGSINHKKEFIVTSTLSSQAPSAVGRALAIPLSAKLLGQNSNFSSSAISYVSVGDGSVNNAHFLSAMNFSKYCEYRGIKCPVVFVVSDNNLCISLKGQNWINEFQKGFAAINKRESADNLQFANGNDFIDIYDKSKLAIDYTRKFSRPSLLIVNQLPRRFGHAATDRQLAYLSKEEIENQISRDPLAATCSAAIAGNLFSETEFESKVRQMMQIVENAFDIAVEEEKITSREALIVSNSKPLIGAVDITLHRTLTPTRGESMRKHMTSAYDELLKNNNECIYIGEDVEHGGYYLVTDGLAAKYPLRVRDFPPDETSLMGAAIGFSQSGLVPIVEIPYCKYLDCAFDMFNDAVIANWLSNGKQPNGMIIRLQGFDKGIFGGNFHTHNSLSFPPGLDVFCFSNGADYVRGLRFAYRQAKAGRVIMLVDSTDLLNKRHLYENERDDLWLTNYPSITDTELSFDSIIVYSPSHRKIDLLNPLIFNVVVISYGNGVPVSLNAVLNYDRNAGETEDKRQVVVSVVDVPCISKVPGRLRDYLMENRVDALVFADVCKSGISMPLGGMAVQLQNEGLLHSKRWKVVGAAPTYNPLGNTVTFLNSEDVLSAINEVIS